MPLPRPFMMFLRALLQITFKVPSGTYYSFKYELNFIDDTSASKLSAADICMENSAGWSRKALTDTSKEDLATIATNVGTKGIEKHILVRRYLVRKKLKRFCNIKLYIANEQCWLSRRRQPSNPQAARLERTKCSFVSHDLRSHLKWPTRGMGFKQYSASPANSSNTRIEATKKFTVSKATLNE